LDIDLLEETAASTGKTVVTKRSGSVGTGAKACLVKIYPPEMGSGPMTLPKGRFVVGRERDCDLPLPNDPAVSRQHAAIEFREGRHGLEDLGSTNGTFVNDELVSARDLQPGDQVRIGANIFKYLRDDVEAQFFQAMYGMMVTDGLTGARTKRFFEEALERELVRAQRHGRPLALVMFDVDHFKSINDNHTHLVGDEALRTICQRVAPTVRKDEVFARWGGEEFALLLPEATREHAIMFGERVRRLVADTPIAVGQLSLSVTVSVGVGWTSGSLGGSPDALVFEADTNLLKGKQSGRNRVVG
jgi:two-component system, cell cycle response regulator